MRLGCDQQGRGDSAGLGHHWYRQGEGCDMTAVLDRGLRRRCRVPADADAARTISDKMIKPRRKPGISMRTISVTSTS